MPSSDSVSDQYAALAANVLGNLRSMPMGVPLVGLPLLLERGSHGSTLRQWSLEQLLQAKRAYQRTVEVLPYWLEEAHLPGAVSPSFKILEALEAEVRRRRPVVYTPAPAKGGIWSDAEQYPP